MEEYKKMKKIMVMFLALLVLMTGFAVADSPVITTRTLSNADDFCGANCFEFYEDVEGEIEIKATDDVDNDMIGLSVDTDTPLPDGATFTQLKAAAGETIFKLKWEADSDWDFNGFTLTFIADDSTADPVTTQDVKIKVYPDFCDRDDEDLQMDKIEIGKIDFDNEDYLIGDTVDVTIENVKAGEDLDNVQAKICLYNVDSNTEIECWDSEDEFDIDKNDKEDYDVSFEIPNDEEIGKKDSYLLFAVIEGEDDDEGDPRCYFESEDIDIERDKYDILITDMTLSPTTVGCGESFQVTVDLENVGYKEDDSVYVKFLERTLGIDERSATYTLEKYDRRDNDATVRETFIVPEDVSEKDYSIEAVVYFDDEDLTKSKFATLTVKDCGPVIPDVPPAQQALLSVDEATRVGDSFSIPVKVTNKAKDMAQFTLEITNVDAWAEAVTGQSVMLDAGQTGTYYFYLNSKEDVFGRQSATVNLKSGANIVKSQPVTIDLGEKQKGFDFGSVDSTVFWIIGDIVLIVLAVFFIKLLFTGKKK